MNIVVTIKQVIDPNLPPVQVGIDPTGQKIVALYGLPPVMNGYDANALECALQLRDAHGGHVTVISVGSVASRASLKRAQAMGADAVVLLDDPSWYELDSAGLGQVLAAAIRKIDNIDLVLCGRQASDTDGGQVLFWIAEMLDMPALCPISKIEGIQDGALTVHRLMDEGYQRVHVQMPALLGISSEASNPRSPSLKGTMLANRALVPTWKQAYVDVPALAPVVELRELSMVTRTSNATFIEGESAEQKGIALANTLHEMRLI